MNLIPFQSQAETASGIAGMALGDAFGAAVPGAGNAIDLAKSLLGGGRSGSTMAAILGPNFGARFITGLIGFLLIAAAIFTHPTVVKVGKQVAKTAGEAAAAA